ncbi:MAG: glycosyl transferase [Pseudomonadales bacterium]
MVSDVALTLLGGGFAVGLALEWLVLTASRRWGVLAHPNARSLHDAPQPTAGGVAFVVPLLAYLGWLGAQGASIALVLCAAAALIAVVGLVDDLRELSARARLAAHALAALAVVWAVLPGAPWPLLALAAFALVWHINLYNFMDGIDGIAGAQALVFLVGAQIVGAGLPGWSGDLTWLASGTLLAFLVFNFPPSRLFMGDVGSGFLGLLTGALALLLWQQQSLPLPAALILLAGFWLDATYTLIVRATTGQAFTQAHRSHLYQKLAAKRGHLWTTVGFLGYAIFWLLPLAWMSARHGMQMSPVALSWLLPAVTPLLVTAWWFRAGLPERRVGSDE